MSDPHFPNWKHPMNQQDTRDLPPLPENLLGILRRIRACESEAPAQLVLERELIDYATSALADRESRVPSDEVSRILWTLEEHNKLHFGEQHSTVVEIHRLRALLTPSTSAAIPAPAAPVATTEQAAIDAAWERIGDRMPSPEKYVGTVAPSVPEGREKPIQFLANATRFKMSFFDRDEDGSGNTGTYVTCFEGFSKELDGRWVALVPAENDSHLNMLAASPPSPAPQGEDARRRLCDLDQEEVRSIVNHCTSGLENENFDGFRCVELTIAAFCKNNGLTLDAAMASSPAGEKI